MAVTAACWEEEDAPEVVAADEKGEKEEEEEMVVVRWGEGGRKVCVSEDEKHSSPRQKVVASAHTLALISHTETQTDRQTDRQADRQTDTHTHTLSLSLSNRPPFLSAHWLIKSTDLVDCLGILRPLLHVERTGEKQLRLLRHQSTQGGPR